MYLRCCEPTDTCSLFLDEHKSWTPHKVELTLWTYCVAKEVKPEVLSKLEELGDDESLKRKRTETQSDSTASKRKR